MTRYVAITLIILTSGCCRDLKPAVRMLRETIRVVRLRGERDGGAVKVTPGLAARLKEAERLAAQALEENDG